MAIPGIPQDFVVQSANQQILLSWSLSTGATSYDIQRSLDNVTFADLVTISGSPLATSYLDVDVTLGTMYYYKVRATTSDGSSSYTTAYGDVPVPTAEMALCQIRLAAQQRADRIDSQFVTLQEWNSYINQAMYELYDLIIKVGEDYIVAEPIQFSADGSTYRFDLPNGLNTFQNADTGVTFTPKAFYKLMGVDLALQNATNAYVTVNKYNFIDRNRFVYPNTSSTIYGVFNLQYRVIGNQIMFVPTPSARQNIRLWYAPRLNSLLQDTDYTNIGISGWLEYVIVRAAKYALDKEESDTNKLDQEILFLTKRIEETAADRDFGIPDTISDTRANGNGGTGGWNGGRGGW